MRFWILLLFTLLMPWSIAEALPPDVFPVDAAMRIRVDFWKRVYTEISSEEAFLHDSEDLSIVYKRISYAGLSQRAKQRFAEEEKRNVQNTLRAIARKKRQGLNEEESRIAAMLGSRSEGEILRMVEDVRRQQGLKDRYFEGLVRAYPYMETIKKIFAAEGLPAGLAYLPHVESSFNYRAYSKVGAAGMWQFMRSSARTYRMRMNYLVDERRDPIISTKAAARFLRDNYNRLQAWPLAITAYNHGPKSIERAVNQHGTRDLSKIIENYENRRFGFASKNFYATFMATAEISENPERYFPEYPKKELPNVVAISLRQRMTMDQISRATGYSKDQLQEFNLALRPSVFRSNFYLPKDFTIQVPAVSEARLSEIKAKFATLQPVVEKKAEEIAGRSDYTVRRGDNLSTIATAHGVEVAELIYANQLERPSAIRPGMKLRIPSPGAVNASVAANTAPDTPSFLPAKSDAPKAGSALPVPSQPTAPTLDVLAKNLNSGSKNSTPLRPLDEILESEMRSVAPQSGFLDELANVEATPAVEVVSGSPKELAKADDLKPEEPKPSWFARLFSGAPKAAPDARPSAAQETPPDEALAPLADSGKAANGDFDPSFYDFDIEKIRESTFRITVEVDETLGHYAEWARATPEQIRRLNRIRGGIRQGQRLLIPIAEGDSMAFHLKRIRYHQAIEEDLFLNYRVTGFSEHRIRRGETVAEICREYEIPFWLLRKYQEQRLPTRLAIGHTLRIPVLQAINDSNTPLGKPASESEVGDI